MYEKLNTLIHEGICTYVLSELINIYRVASDMYCDMILLCKAGRHIMLSTLN